MSDKIGKLDKVVSFLVNTPTDAGAGGQVDSYSTALTCRGALMTKSGFRSDAFGDIVAASAYYLLVRKQSDLLAILNTSTKVQIETQTYAIVGWDDDKDSKLYYRIDLAKEIKV